MTHSLLTGAVVSGGLIVAIGSQNAFLLKCGLKKQYALSVATICFLGDIFLISTGVLGLGALLNEAPFWKSVLTLGGVLFLLWYGYQSAKSAWRGSSHLELDNSNVAQSWLKVSLMAIAITFLNPHVYLDTVVILGGVTAQMESVEKLWFVAGALIASGVWFYGLVYLSNKLIPLFSKPRTWRILDSVVSCIMFGIAFKLAIPLLSHYI
ncbi:amino acid transporter [Pseudoalteromonas sp. BZK2]|uniref:LysE/ArgO family amino acid transporter n=1 Tax=unclassified Pseudoalteromonas TaxID=194690 RepID=UPI0016543C14|nr:MULTISPECIES: LysE/ArgO family amino acid transporter [unclassified Pseudoalteromonas]MBC7010178.1 amino acid transporter [Pseudoalteromonas sp. BZK2]MCH2089603.1 LysE/ArgO family amino acid transporter [Pseudoalteromonas sp.]